jgi:hypothetical protein
MEMEKKKIRKKLWCNYKVKGYNNTIETFRHERFFKNVQNIQKSLKKNLEISQQKKGMKISLHL